MRIQNLRNVARDALLRRADPWEIVQVDGLTTTVEHMATLVVLYDLSPRVFNRERKRLSVTEQLELEKKERQARQSVDMEEDE